MASAADPKAKDLKADAAAEKAYADAAKEITTKTAAPPAVKAAPAVAKKTPAKKAPAKKAPTKKVIATTAPAKKPTPKTKAKPAPKAPVKKAAPKAAAPKKATPPKPTASKPKETIMTKTTDFTKTVKDAAAEIQTKAKAGFEKAKTYATEVAEFSKGNVEASVESGKILASGMQDMARSEAEAAKSAFETATADMKSFAGIKSPTDLFKLQGEIARRNFDAVVAHYSKSAEASMKLANDAFAPLSNRMSLAAEKFSKVA